MDLKRSKRRRRDQKLAHLWGSRRCQANLGTRGRRSQETGFLFPRRFCFWCCCCFSAADQGSPSSNRSMEPSSSTSHLFDPWLHGTMILLFKLPSLW